MKGLGDIAFSKEFVRLSAHRSFISSYLSFVVGSKFYVKVYETLYYEDPSMDSIHIWPDGRYRSKVFISTDPTPGNNLGVKVTDLEFS